MLRVHSGIQQRRPECCTGMVSLGNAFFPAQITILDSG